MTVAGPDPKALHEAVAAASDQAEVLRAVHAFRGELNERMGIEITEFGPERVVASMPVAGNRQPFGLLHGGANGVLAESLGSFHATLLGGPDRLAVGIELNCTHHRSAYDGTVQGVSIPLHTGRTLLTFGIVISDERERRICTARLTCLLRDAPAG